MAEIDSRCLANGMKAALGKQECGTIILCMPETELLRAFFLVCCRRYGVTQRLLTGCVF